MAFCKYCGKKLDDDAKFCPQCGKQVGEVASTVQMTNTAQRQRKQIFDGEIRKCPNCGAVLNAFEVACPNCGFELRGSKSSSIVQDFSRQLDAISAEKFSFPQAKSTVPSDGHKSKKEIEAELEERKAEREVAIELEKEKRQERKLMLIQNFPIPNTKEDIFEFMILAVSNLGLSEDKKENAAWMSKFDQAYHKAKLSFGDSPDLKRIVDDYKVKRKKLSVRHIGAALLGFAVVVAIVLMFAIPMISMGRDVDAENERLQLILNEINECMEQKDYTKARALTTKLVFTVTNAYDASSTSKEYWDNVREELYEVIDRAEGITSSAQSESAINSNPLESQMDSVSPFDNDIDNPNASGEGTNKSSVFIGTIGSGIDAFWGWLNDTND